MGIVRRCGRPPRSGPGPVIQKPTRERMPVRIAAAGAGGGAAVPPRRDGREPQLAVAVQLVIAAVGAVDRRLPPRIPVLPVGAIPLLESIRARAHDHEVDAVICSCRVHAAVTAAR